MSKFELVIFYSIPGIFLHNCPPVQHFKKYIISKYCTHLVNHTAIFHFIWHYFFSFYMELEKARLNYIIIFLFLIFFDVPPYTLILFEFHSRFSFCLNYLLLLLGTAVKRKPLPHFIVKKDHRYIVFLV